MNRYIINSAIIGAGLVLLVCSLTGCCITRATYTNKDGTTATISNYRCMWTSDSYGLDYGTNHLTFTAAKTGTDNEALGMVVNAAISAAAKSAKP